MSYRNAAAGDLTLPGLLEMRAEHSPDEELFTDEVGTLSAADAFVTAAKVAAGLRECGIQFQDRVAIMLHNSREFLYAWFGVAALGAVQVPINPQTTGRQLSYVLRHSGAKAIFVSGDLLERVVNAFVEVPGLEWLFVIGEQNSAPPLRSVGLNELLDRSPYFGGIRSVTARDTAAIMYTSGSTGAPKGVVMPYGQHFENGRQAVAVARITPDDRVFVSLPLHHNMAQGYGILPALVSGARVSLVRRFHRATFWDEVCESGSTVLPFVGSMLVLLMKDARSQAPAEASNPLRVGYGVPIPKEVHRVFEDRFSLTLVPCYGSTEATIIAWGSLLGDAPVGSCGRILPNFEVEIQSEEGLPLGPDEVGEICVRPRQPYVMFQGYHDEPERGRLAVRNLWFHSGDRARLDREGYLWFEGRAADVVRRFGEFISPTEVEEVLLGLPAVDMVAAFGVPDEVAGEELMVAVVAVAGARLSAADVRTWCEERLSAYAVPRYIEVVDELPMTATGKVEKYRLRERGISAETDDGRGQD